MADDDALELDTGGEKSGGGSKKIIILSIVISLVITSVVIGVLFATGMLGGGDSDGEDSEEAAAETVIKPAHYIDLGAPFIVNFESNTMASYLQIEMQLMARDKSINDIVTRNMPVIRNNILLIMSAQTYETVKDRAGKEKLQATILEELRKIIGEASVAKMKQEKGDEAKEIDVSKVPNIEQVYFTSFVMQ